MAIATQITVETGSRVEEQGAKRHVRLSITYTLERQDTDLPAVAAKIGAELERAHYKVWECMEYSTDPRKTARKSDVPDEPLIAAQASQVSPSGNGAESSENRSAHNGRGNNDSRAAIAEPTPQATEPVTSPQKIALRSLANRFRKSESDLNQLVFQRFGKRTINDLTKQEASTLMQSLQQGDWSLPQPAHA